MLSPVFLDCSALMARNVEPPIRAAAKPIATAIEVPMCIACPSEVDEVSVFSTAADYLLDQAAACRKISSVTVGGRCAESAGKARRAPDTGSEFLEFIGNFRPNNDRRYDSARRANVSRDNVLMAAMRLLAAIHLIFNVEMMGRINRCR